MKLKLDLDINWINEDGRIEDEVKDQVIDRIVALTKSSLMPEIKRLSLIRIKDNVDIWITEQLELFCDRNIAITDKWGDTIEHHESVNDLFKTKFDFFFNASVDEKGNPIKGCSVGSRTTRLEQMLTAKADAYMAKVLQNLDNKISNYISKAQQERIATTVKDKVIEKLIEIEKNN